MADFLVDSNILVYVHDPRDRPKQERAFEVLDRLIKSKSAVLSVQCLSEFFNTVCWKLPEPLSKLDALAQVESFTLSCRVLSLTPHTVLEACRFSNSHGFSTWDSLIWAVAKLNGVPCIVTEDNEDGRVIEGVRYLNPFHPNFDASLLGVT